MPRELRTFSAPTDRGFVILEKTLARRGFVNLSASNSDAREVTDLEGTLKAAPGLHLLDLEVLAVATALRRSHQTKWDTFPMTVASCLYQRQAGGKELRLVEASIERLQDARLEFVGYSAKIGRWNARTGAELVISNDGAGQPSEFLQPSRWISDNLESGYAVQLQWNVLRALRGLAKRLWIFLESHDFETPSRGLTPSFSLKLRPETFATLGMNYGRKDHARRAISAAASKISAFDAQYDFGLSREGSQEILHCRRKRAGTLRRRNVDPSWILGRPIETPSAENVYVWTHDIQGTIRRYDEARGLYLATYSPGGLHSAHYASCPELLLEAVESDRDGTVLVGSRRLSDLVAWFNQQGLRVGGCQVCVPTKRRYP